MPSLHINIVFVRIGEERNCSTCHKHLHIMGQEASRQAGRQAGRKEDRLRMWGVEK